MVFYINKQAVEIKARFENAPLTSANEVCSALGMLYKIYNLPFPGKREMVSKMKADFFSAAGETPAPSAFAAKITTLLDGYYKDEPVKDEVYDLMKYCYEEQ